MISIPETEGARRAAEVNGMDVNSNQNFLPTEAVVNAPDPEVSQIAKRRRFSAEYKLEVLRKTDACGKLRSNPYNIS